MAMDVESAQGVIGRYCMHGSKTVVGLLKVYVQVNYRYVLCGWYRTKKYVYMLPSPPSTCFYDFKNRWKQRNSVTLTRIPIYSPESDSPSDLAKAKADAADPDPEDDEPCPLDPEPPPINEELSR